MTHVIIYYICTKQKLSRVVKKSELFKMISEVDDAAAVMLIIIEYAINRLQSVKGALNAK